jgi:molybdate transport system permease protein
VAASRSHPLKPRGLVAIAVLGLAIFLVLPLVGLVAQAPWGRIAADVGDPAIRSAFLLSLVVSGVATALALVFGIPIAWLLVRTSFRGQRFVRTLTTLPLVLPPVVGGVALLLAFGNDGLIGGWLDASFGIGLQFTTAGAILAATFAAMPFLVLTVDGALRSLDPGYEETASTLGARPFASFMRVTLPLIRPSIAAGAALAWARALGEFGATITFAGNVAGRTRTVPLAIYALLDTNREAAIMLSLVLLAVSVAILLAVGPRARSALPRGRS